MRILVTTNAAVGHFLPMAPTVAELGATGHDWDSLGHAHHHLGDHVDAIACYQRALDLIRDLGGGFCDSVILVHRGDAHHAVGDRAAARDAWRQALAILDDLRHPDADQVRAKLDDLASTGRRESRDSQRSQQSARMQYQPSSAS
jgi:tetratricopeptide (TPR) repeat protein